MRSASNVGDASLVDLFAIRREPTRRSLIKRPLETGKQFLNRPFTKRFLADKRALSRFSRAPYERISAALADPSLMTRSVAAQDIASARQERLAVMFLLSSSSTAGSLRNHETSDIHRRIEQSLPDHREDQLPCRASAAATESLLRQRKIHPPYPRAALIDFHSGDIGSLSFQFPLFMVIMLMNRNIARFLLAVAEMGNQRRFLFGPPHLLDRFVYGHLTALSSFIFTIISPERMPAFCAGTVVEQTTIVRSCSSCRSRRQSLRTAGNILLEDLFSSGSRERGIWIVRRRKASLYRAMKQRRQIKGVLDRQTVHRSRSHVFFQNTPNPDARHSWKWKYRRCRQRKTMASRSMPIASALAPPRQHIGNRNQKRHENIGAKDDRFFRGIRTFLFLFRCQWCLIHIPRANHINIYNSCRIIHPLPEIPLRGCLKALQNATM